MAALEELQALRDAMSEIDGVKTCKIGIEANISPADYPLVRLVPARLTAGAPYNQRTVEVTVYFGADLADSAGLEVVYQKLFDLEAELIKAIKAQDGVYIETFTDEDRLDAYKLMYIRCEIKTQRPAVT